MVGFLDPGTEVIKLFKLITVEIYAMGIALLNSSGFKTLESVICFIEKYFQICKTKCYISEPGL